MRTRKLTEEERAAYDAAVEPIRDAIRTALEQGQSPRKLYRQIAAVQQAQGLVLIRGGLRRIVTAEPSALPGWQRQNANKPFP